MTKTYITVSLPWCFASDVLEFEVSLQSQLGSQFLQYGASAVLAWDVNSDFTIKTTCEWETKRRRRKRHTQKKVHTQIATRMTREREKSVRLDMLPPVS